jgi:hypothetical protein
MRATAPLLIEEVGIVYDSQPCVVARREHPPKLAAGGGDTAGHNESGLAEIDEANLAAGVDPPTVAKLGGEAGLASVRDLHIAGGGHGVHCNRAVLQGKPP